MAIKYEEGQWVCGGENYDMYYKGSYVYYSDVSDEPLDDDDVYLYKGKHYSSQELIEKLGYLEADEYLANYEEEREEITETCYMCNGRTEYVNIHSKKFICEKCLIEEIEEYRLQMED